MSILQTMSLKTGSTIWDSAGCNLAAHTAVSIVHHFPIAGLGYAKILLANSLCSTRCETAHCEPGLSQIGHQLVDSLSTGWAQTLGTCLLSGNAQKAWRQDRGCFFSQFPALQTAPAGQNPACVCDAQSWPLKWQPFLSSEMWRWRAVEWHVCNRHQQQSNRRLPIAKGAQGAFNHLFVFAAEFVFVKLQWCQRPTAQ